MSLTLYGYRFSVYTRIARMVLIVRSLEYQSVEVNPFDELDEPALNELNPFGRVPVLDHDGFVLFETSAICRYLATAFPGPALIPEDPARAARMAQVIAVIDAYGYQPMVRQVFSHAVFRPEFGLDADPLKVKRGLVAAAPVLRQLDDTAREGLILNGSEPSLADFHLLPMIGYFVMADAGRAALDNYPHLAGWFTKMRDHSAYRKTDPGLDPGLASPRPR